MSTESVHIDHSQSKPSDYLLTHCQGHFPQILKRYLIAELFLLAYEQLQDQEIFPKNSAGPLGVRL